MSAPTFINHGGIAASTGASVDVPYMGSISANDILIVQILDSDDDTFQTPANWNLIWETGSDKRNASCAWFWFRASGGESGTVTFTSNSVDGAAIFGIMGQYSGCTTHDNPYDVSIMHYVVRQATTYTVGNIWALNAERLVLALPSIEDNVGTTPPSGWVEEYDVGDTTGGDASLCCHSLATSTSTYEYVDVDTSAIGGDEYHSCITIALIPATVQDPIIFNGGPRGFSGTTQDISVFIADTGDSDPTKVGVCWNTTGSPTISDNYSELTGSTYDGYQTIPVTNMTVGQKIYYKGYIYRSDIGYLYAEELQLVFGVISQVSSDSDGSSYTKSNALKISSTEINIAAVGAGAFSYISTCSTTGLSVDRESSIQFTATTKYYVDSDIIDSTHSVIIYSSSTAIDIATVSWDGGYTQTEEDLINIELASSDIQYCKVIMLSTTVGILAYSYRNGITYYLVTKSFTLDGSYQITIVDTETSSSTLVKYNLLNLQKYDSTHFIISYGHYVVNNIDVLKEGSFYLKMCSIDGSNIISFDDVSSRYGVTEFSAIKLLDSSTLLVIYCDQGRDYYYPGKITCNIVPIVAYNIGVIGAPINVGYEADSEIMGSSSSLINYDATYGWFLFLCYHDFLTVINISADKTKVICYGSYKIGTAITGPGTVALTNNVPTEDNLGYVGYGVTNAFQQKIFKLAAISTGWAGKINGVDGPGKVNSIGYSDIEKVNEVS